MGNHFFALNRHLAWILRTAVVVGVCCPFVELAIAQESVGGSAPPSIRAGDWLTVNLRTKIQLDFEELRPEIDEDRKTFENRKLRFGADGTLFNYLDYAVSVETRKGDPEFRDLFFKYRLRPFFQIQAGRFKIPFGLDQLTNSGELDFVERSRVGAILAPGRDAGVMVQGEALEGKVDYAAGIFRYDGRNSEIEDLTAIDEYLPAGKRTLAARATLMPSAFLPVPTVFQNLRVGAAFTHSHAITGLSSLEGVTVSSEVFFPRMYVSGTRLRRGLELSWLLRSLSIKGEFTNVREQRLGQGPRGEDLPALRTQGWYLSATHPVLGHLDNGSSGSFLRSIVPGTRLGLFEATARYEMIRFESEPSVGFQPSRNPRAANVVGNDDRAWTFGINWHANRYVKFQFNGVRETLRDPVRTPIDGQNHYWTQVGRLQLFF